VTYKQILAQIARTNNLGSVGVALVAASKR
jgi:hypothetical protein